MLDTVASFLPVLLVCLLSFIVLSGMKNDLEAPEDHFGKYGSEFSIFAGNVSAALSATIFWVLYIYSYKSFGFPAFISTFVGTATAYFIFLVALRTNDRQYSILGLIQGTKAEVQQEANKVPLTHIMYFSTTIIILMVEISFLREFLSHSLSNSAFWISITSATLLVILCAIYTMWGGMRAVLRTDAVFIIVIALGLAILFLSEMTGLQNLAETKFLRTLKEEFSGTKCLPLSYKDYANFGSATVYVAIMYLYFPDYWHRIRGLEPERESARVTSTVFSLLVTLAILVLGYFIAIESRTPYDQQHLCDANAIRSYEFSNIVAAFSSFTNETLVFFVLPLVLLVSSLTTLDSLIIALAAFFHRSVGKQGNVQSYKFLLGKLFVAMVFLLILSGILNFKNTVFIAAIIGSIQLVLVFSVFFHRIMSILFQVELLIVAGSIVQLGLLFANHVYQWKFYYPLLAIVSSTIVCVSFFFVGWLRGRYA